MNIAMPDEEDVDIVNPHVTVNEDFPTRKPMGPPRGFRTAWNQTPERTNAVGGAKQYSKVEFSTGDGKTKVGYAVAFDGGYVLVAVGRIAKSLWTVPVAFIKEVSV